MKKYYLILLLIVLSISPICFGQSHIGESDPGYLTSRVPGTLHLASPANASENQTDPILFTWSKLKHTSFYQLQIAKDEEFTSLVIKHEQLVDTTRSIAGLESNTSYYWRVRASNVAGDGEFSETWQFTTIVDRPDRAVLAEPAHEATDVPISLQLKWLSLELADSYTLQVAENPDFTNPLINEEGLSDSVYTLTELQNNTSYYWRVRASNVAGDGEFSETWNFTTVDAVGIRELTSKKEKSMQSPVPNPFSEITIITYTLSEPCKFKLFIYNSHGQLIRELISAHQAAGEYRVKWNGRDDMDADLPDGLYICVLSTPHGVYSQKVLYQQ